jgi:hypothetical protein
MKLDFSPYLFCLKSQREIPIRILKGYLKKELAARAPHENKIQMAIKVANKYNTDLAVLREQLGRFDKQTLSFLAMEVAKEYADYHWREDLH